MPITRNPRHEWDHEYEGETFRLRTMSSELEDMIYADAFKPDGSMDPLAVVRNATRIVAECVVGWSMAEPAFSRKGAENAARLDGPARIHLAYTVWEQGRVSESESD